MSGAERRHTSDLLVELRNGSTTAADRLLPVVYDQLRALAGSYFRDQQGVRTLEPTALVHEAFVRLIDRSGEGWADESHFLAVAAVLYNPLMLRQASAKTCTIYYSYSCSTPATDALYARRCQERRWGRS